MEARASLRYVRISPRKVLRDGSDPQQALDEALAYLQ